jgi:hypothetical protein
MRTWKAGCVEVAGQHPGPGRPEALPQGVERGLVADFLDRKQVRGGGPDHRRQSVQLRLVRGALHCAGADPNRFATFHVILVNTATFLAGPDRAWLAGHTG